MEEFQQISDQLSLARETMSRVRYLECRLNGNNDGETSLVMIGNQSKYGRAEYKNKRDIINS